MKITILISLMVLSATVSCLAQSDSSTHSQSWVPKEMKGETLFVEKYSEISTQEAMDIINTTSASKSKDEYLENIFSYNLVFRRKINNEIETVFDKYELKNISTLSKRDILENLDDNVRFVLKAEFSAVELITGKNYSPSFYIYDQNNDIRYKSFRSLDIMLKSLKSFNWYADNRITSETAQATIDDYIERNLPNERKPLMSKSTKTSILGVLVFGALIVLGYIGSN